MNFVDYFLRILFTASLQIGVDEKVHRVELVAFPAHVHGRFFLGCGDGGLVGVDIVLPQPEPRENVCRHVQGMRGCRSERCIFACCRQSLLRHVGLVVGMYQVVRHAWMVRIFSKQFF